MENEQFVVVDIIGMLLFQGSYGACEWYKEKGEGILKLAHKIILREDYFNGLIGKTMKSTWWNTLNRMIEIEGGKLNNDSIKLVNDLIKHYLLPKEYQFSQDRIELAKWYKVGFMIFDDFNINEINENRIIYDLGEFVRFRLTFGDRPINRDAIIDINIKLL